MTTQTQNTASRALRKTTQNDANERRVFWGFCTRVSARTRFIKGPARGTLTAHDIDKLFVDQKWRCAISDIRFEPPGDRAPFAPSIDRIKAGGKYEVGNVRLVCNIVNYAMNEWGEEALHRLVWEMSGSDT